jgi:hypothetical protein
LLLQPLALAGWAFAAWQLIDGTRWLAVFLPLVALLVFWVGQAVHAHRRALAVGAAPGGELQLAWFLPVVLALVSAFWLLGGRHGSPASAVEAYMTAWQSGRPDLALSLYANDSQQQADIAGFWSNLRNTLVARVTQGRAEFGPTSGLDPQRPFSSLRVEQVDPVTFNVAIVRAESFRTTLLGFIPTAGQRTTEVEQLLQIRVVEIQVGGWLPSSRWQLDWVEPSGSP